MPSHPRQPHWPPRPTEATNRHDFGKALRALRSWSGLTQRALEDAHSILTDSTISDHERGVRLPRLEWLQAYVTVCLRHRHRTAEHHQLDTEFQRHWRTVWTRLNNTDTSPALAVPTQHIPAPDRPTSVDAGVPTQTQPAAPIAPATPSRRARWKRRRVWLISAGAAVAAAVAVYATATSLVDATPSTPDTSETLTGTTAPAVPVHASGTIDDLGTKQGIDLDTGQRLEQNAPGVDISFSSISTHMDAMHESVYYQVLPTPVSVPQKHMCQIDTGWKREYKYVHDLTEGRAICVKTDERRLSMMTVTKRATNATATISLRFVTWA